MKESCDCKAKKLLTNNSVFSNPFSFLSKQWPNWCPCKDWVTATSSHLSSIVYKVTPKVPLLCKLLRKTSNATKIRSPGETPVPPSSPGSPPGFKFSAGRRRWSPLLTGAPNQPCSFRPLFGVDLDWLGAVAVFYTDLLA